MSNPRLTPQLTTQHLYQTDEHHKLASLMAYVPVNSSCGHPPPQGLVGHISTLSVPGVGYWSTPGHLTVSWFSPHSTVTSFHGQRRQTCDWLTLSIKGRRNEMVDTHNERSLEQYRDWIGLILVRDSLTDEGNWQINLFLAVPWGIWTVWKARLSSAWDICQWVLKKSYYKCPGGNGRY